MPATVARAATRTGVVTDVATPTWLSAATTPRPTTNQRADAASSRPYGRPPSALPTSERRAPPIAAATTTTTIATAALGSQATTPARRADTGFGPHTPNASCNVNSRTA